MPGEASPQSAPPSLVPAPGAACGALPSEPSHALALPTSPPVAASAAAASSLVQPAITSCATESRGGVLGAAKGLLGYALGWRGGEGGAREEGGVCCVYPAVLGVGGNSSPASPQFCPAAAAAVSSCM